MPRSIFGWDLPPGCSMRDIDPPEPPCECCGKADCICPECLQCGESGNPKCYKHHGMRYTDEQLAGQKALKEQLEADAKLDQERADAYYRDLEQLEEQPPHPASEAVMKGLIDGTIKVKD